MKVLSIGEVLWDVYPHQRILGGAPANFTFHALQLGNEAAIISAVGTDNLGRDLQESLHLAGMTLFFNTSSYPTGVSKVSFNQAGEPSYELVYPSAWDDIQLSEQAIAYAKTADLIYFGSLAQRHPVSRLSVMQLVQNKRENAKVIFDVNLRQHYYDKAILAESMMSCQVLKINEREAEIMTQIFQEGPEAWLVTFNIDIIILTLGHMGSRVITPLQNLFCPAHPCELVDPVGAGDAYAAAFMVQLLKGVDLETCQKQASRIASYVCEHKGATVALPKTLIDGLL